MMVDGLDNSVYEVNTVADPRGPENPHRNAYHTEATLVALEGEAQRIIDPSPAVRDRQPSVPESTRASRWPTS